VQHYQAASIFMKTVEHNAVIKSPIFMSFLVDGDQNVSKTQVMRPITEEDFITLINVMV
jgi:hypothetical protein